MKIKALTSLITALVLVLTGCSARVEEPSAPPSQPDSFEEAALSIPLPESLPVSESSEQSKSDPLEDPLSEPTDSSSELTLAQPDKTPPTNRPLARVAKITDEELAAALTTPLEELALLDNQSVVWGPGVTTQEQPPSEPLRLQQLYGSLGGSFIFPTDQLYLSFDEGYELGYTPAILDTLKEKDVKAVFFVTLGYVESRPDLVQRILDEGHILGNHSSSHPVGGMPTLSTGDMGKDILYLHNYVKENFQYKMTFFRPPEGVFSPRSLAVAQALGYQSVFWSFAYNDWNPDGQPEPVEAIKTITSRSHPGAIYLLHAVSATNTTVLGDVIDQLRGKGYSFASWQN